jgi:NADPH:quinone reductase
MSTKATAARIYEYGEPDVFRFETMDVPDPVGHEVLVRNTVIGLNFVDIYYRRGTLSVPEFPAIIGDEASGVVEAVGPNVTLVKVGDRVAYADALGAYTTVRLYPEDRLTVIPDGVSNATLFANAGWFRKIKCKHGSAMCKWQRKLVRRTSWRARAWANISRSKSTL